MIEQIVLGIIQGIVEWLPVSSEGFIVLAKTNFFPPHVDLQTVIEKALFSAFRYISSCPDLFS